MNPLALCVLAGTPELEALASRLRLPLCDTAQAQAYGHVLCLQEGRLALRENSAHPASPTLVDFADPALAYRRRTSGKAQGIGRAVGLRKLTAPRVLDCSAGLGRDAFILAALGCHLTLLERSPVIHALLEDGLRRARADESEELRGIAARMDLHLADARDWLAEVVGGERERPEVVYLDPMFPARGKTAKVKKDIATLQRLLGPDADVDEVLALACQAASRRVVLKRPAGKVGEGAREPDFRVTGKASRFDVYLCGGDSDS